MLAFKRHAAKRWPPEKLSELLNHNQICRIKMETKLRQLVKFIAPRSVWVYRRAHTVCVSVLYTYIRKLKALIKSKLTGINIFDLNNNNNLCIP